jgi:hypothetical protein
MAKQLKTPQSPWTKVFRRIVQQLENNPSVKRVVGHQNLRSWSGVSADKAPFEPTSSSPVVRLTPMPSGVDWLFPEAQSGTLRVSVEIAILSLCVDDVVDLWDVFVDALLPLGPAIPDTGTNFRQDLTALGAETGEITFADPAVDPRPADQPEGVFLAVGGFWLKVQRSTLV